MNIEAVKALIEKDGIVFLTYGGFLSQTLIVGMTEALEKEAEHNDISIGESTDIFTIFIELAQNMMNYSKVAEESSTKNKSEGLIIVGRCDDEKRHYYILSQNVIALQDKEKIEPKLQEIITLNKEELKKRYRELRKSGRDTHDKGGGIGFYEIAKRSDGVEYSFTPINAQKYYFQFKAYININKKD
jgi:Family of unknown function (DUF6272)